MTELVIPILPVCVTKLVLTSEGLTQLGKMTKNKFVFSLGIYTVFCQLKCKFLYDERFKPKKKNKFTYHLFHVFKPPPPSPLDEYSNKNFKF